MGGSRVRVAQPSIARMRAAAFIAAALLLVACQVLSGRPSLPVSAAAIVELGSEAAAAQLRDGRVSVYVAVPGQGGQAGTSSPIASSAAAPAGTVNLLSYGGDTGEEWNTFVYGNAPPGVSRVELTMTGGVGGQVVDGAWLIVLPDLDVTPDDLHWRFLDLDGTTLTEGDGILTGQ